ncbi:GH92 family glycosyl hydrolase [Sphaerisporangium fuscum]|uniref:GH92 family glycosyl hydrolase n=1 Tax=Sphaerisporangium fuscum TaxID=2835868 RepID=UPI001BDC5E58|nr:GH92 family glycosyl hydrolase [Sphaerisporangium fuscum]
MSRSLCAAAVATALLIPSPALAAAPAAKAQPEPASYVNTFLGTQDGGPDFGHGGGAGMNFPGAAVPFGMMQWSPDTVRRSGGGYKYEDNRLRGLSMTHINGPGCSGAQDFPVVPISGTIGASPATHGDDYIQTFGHAGETASPGYYGVTLDSGVKAETTATTRAGIGRFTGPAGKPLTLLINVTGSVNGVGDAEAKISGNTVSGWARTGGFCGTKNQYYVYFHATFDKPVRAYGTWKNDSVAPGTAQVSGRSESRIPRGIVKPHGLAAPTAPPGDATPPGKDGRPTPEPSPAPDPGAMRRQAAAQDVIVKGPGSGVYLQFDPATPVQMRAGLSYVGIDGAKANLKQEIGGKGFDRVAKDARAAWNEQLGRIQVTGGDDQQKRTFYSNLYHALLQPYVFDDADGTYTGFDYRTHTVRRGHHHYATFSGWDIYRSEAQLIALLRPDVASDIAQSMYDDAHSIGDVWDRWSHQNTITGVMNGDPYHSIIASVYALGARDFDAKAALAAMVKGARRVGTDPGTGYDERPGNAAYMKNGYVPADPSTTLEYGIADFGIAQLAERLGDTATRDEFMKRAQGWQSTYNPANGWIQPRFGDGSFLPGFDPASPNWYVEGNGAQYHWMVPHNARGLFDAMGGDGKAVERLDTFFTELNAGSGKPYAYLGNEPSLLTPWLYVWAGKPYKTQDVVARARKELFKPTPDGLTGNDDLGTMGAWYVWASLGMYPAIPGRAELVLNSPAFEKIVVTRSNGKTITIEAPGASVQNRYVRSLKVNGAASTKAWLPEGFSGRLDYTLGAEPDTAFGSAPQDAPPSFQAGAKPYLVSVEPGGAPVEPGGTLTATVQVQAAGKGGEVRWSATPPAGVTVTPASGSLQVPDYGKGTVQVTVTVAAGAAVGFTSVPFEVAGVPAGLKLNVARKGTIEWYHNNAGVGDDTEAGLANFDGGGWSYSAQALAAVKAKPGAALTWKGYTFTWPQRKPGDLDNVQASGQTIDLAGVPQGARTLALLGSGASGDIQTKVTITYTDGTTQDTTVGFSDWALAKDAYQPRFGNEIVLKTPYRLDAGGDKQEINVYVFAATPVQLDAAKQVRSMTLAAPTGRATAHLFAWTFGT